LLSIFYTVVPVTQWLRDGNRAYSETHALRISIDELTLRFRMKSDRLEELRDELFTANTKFVAACERSPRFPGSSEKFLKVQQEKLNRILSRRFDTEESKA
jgi:hypothetical protein